MSEHTRIHLTSLQMRQLARYELTFKDLLPERILDAIMTGLMSDEDGSCYAYEVSEDIEAETYQMTMADLTSALHNMQVGDTVIVNGYDGETAVEVIAVRTVRESELGLPVERYKRVVRKA